MSDRAEFESWFLKLNRDFSANDLTTIGGSGDYFYTTTHALYELFTERSHLEAQLTEERERVRVLREAMDWIDGACDTGAERCACGRPNGLPAIRSRAQRALQATAQEEIT